MQKFDFVIVGAGSAGCVLADQLSASGRHSVLLVEAGGPDNSPYIHMPKGIGRIVGDPKRNLFYQTEPEPGNGGVGEVWLRGKTLGGSSAINGMVYNRGQPADYDNLESLGCPGWGWSDMLPHFKAIENHPLGASAWRGEGGPLGLSLPPADDPLNKIVLSALAFLGLRRLEDLNEDHGAGAFGLLPQTIYRGKRMSSAVAFLKPAMRRSNLSVATGKHVDKLVLEGNRVVGLRCVDGTEYRCGREIILSAGALESPGILMRSGIGDAQDLQAMGIAPIYHAPQMGRNLIEHRTLTPEFEVSSYKYSQNNRFSGWRLLAGVSAYYAARSGTLSRGSFEIGIFPKVTEGPGRPDSQILLFPYTIDPAKFPLGTGDTPQIAFAGFISRPDSRGSLKLRSSDPLAPPVIRPNYLATEHDRAVAIGTIRYIRKIAGAAPLRDIIVRETSPGHDTRSDEELLDAWSTKGGCGYHTIGTCAMGSDPQSVTDPNLRVRGVEGVRVMDNSVLPSMVSGNTNAPMMAMARRASALILQDA